MDLSNLYYLIQILVWRVVRKPRIVDFIYAASKPLRDVVLLFNALRDNTRYELQFNGQVIYLEHVLNDLFDPVNREIYITDDANIEYTYIYLNGESGTNQPYIYLNSETPTNQAYLATSAEQLSQYHFIVNIPATVVDLYGLRAIIDKYKLAGRRYSINVI